MIKLTSLIAVAAIALCGCALKVPTTKISGNIGGQKFNGEFPKDSDLTELEVSAQTNGTVRLKIGALKTRMNPDVVGQTAVGQAALLEAGLNGAGNIAGNVVQKALQAYLAQYGAPISTASPAPMATTNSAAK